LPLFTDERRKNECFGDGSHFGWRSMQHHIRIDSAGEIGGLNRKMANETREAAWDCWALSNSRKWFVWESKSCISLERGIESSVLEGYTYTQQRSAGKYNSGCGGWLGGIVVPYMECPAS
jgi:hypothetical protein